MYSRMVLVERLLGEGQPAACQEPSLAVAELLVHILHYLWPITAVLFFTSLLFRLVCICDSGQTLAFSWL